jgi:hypothetical protein
MSIAYGFRCWSRTLVSAKVKTPRLDPIALKREPLVAERNAVRAPWERRNAFMMMNVGKGDMLRVYIKFGLLVVDYFVAHTRAWVRIDREYLSGYDVTLECIETRATSLAWPWKISAGRVMPAHQKLPLRSPSQCQ